MLTLVFSFAVIVLVILKNARMVFRRFNVFELLAKEVYLGYFAKSLMELFVIIAVCRVQP